jgi:hypothetical protein
MMMKSICFADQRSAMKRFLVAVLFSVFFLPGFLHTMAYAETYEASSLPWSGYWWPYRYGGLGTGQDYRGRPAPLEKYYLHTTGRASGTALDWYLKFYFNPNAPAWYGLCANWARAACFEDIDILPSSENNIIFRIGDKKGLLTLAHMTDATASADGSHPEVFHLWLLDYIKDQKKAFVADLDAGPEVWSYAIFKYVMEASRTGDVESYKVVVYFADDHVPPDFRGTQVDAKAYTYDLFLDGTGAITDGRWTGSSIDDHPAVLKFPMAMDTAPDGLDYQEILMLARSKDDFLEKGSEIVEIDPGTYNLILLDEDVYTIPTVSGDILTVRIEKEPGSLQDIDVVVVDGNGAEVRRAIVSDSKPMDILITSTVPPYLIRLTQADYTDPNIYVLKADVKRLYNREVPYIPGSEWWSGFALTNTGSVGVERVTLTTRDRQGAPIQTVLGTISEPLRLGPGEKRIFLFDDLPVRLHELSETARLTLTADGPVGFLNLIGVEDRSLATFVQGDAPGSRLVIPDTAAPLTPGVRMFGAVKNDSFEEAQVTLRLYSAAGAPLKEVQGTIAARGWLPIEPGSAPFYYSMPKSGWIEIQGNGEQPLSGFQYTSDPSGVETLFALPVGSSKKIVPQVPEPGYWRTRVTLINPNDTDNPVKLHLARAGADGGGDLDITLAPHEKKVLEIQDQFGKREGDPLDHSILEITGLHPLVGYFTYSIINGKDYASYPLLDDTHFKRMLSLPHYPGNNDYWRTGIVVCNPSVAAVTVRIEPYDYEGNLLEGSVISVNLAAGAYDVFEVASRFGESAPGISFIKFRTEGDSGAIGGLYLYSDSRNRVLSGANME